MALSNIFNEPRREITESLVGLAIAIILLAPTYPITQWLGTTKGGPPFFILVVAAIFIELGAVFLTCAFFVLTHFLGEAVCDALQRRGIHFRPRRRYE